MHTILVPVDGSPSAVSVTLVRERACLEAAAKESRLQGYAWGDDVGANSHGTRVRIDLYQLALTQTAA